MRQAWCMATLPYIAAVLLGLGALGGAVLAVLHLGRRRVPLWMAVPHGLLVAPGLLVLLIALALHGRVQSRGEVSRFDQLPEIQLAIAAGLFILAAIGGLILFVRHGKGWKLPAALIIAHGLTALAGYVVLLIAIL